MRTPLLFFSLFALFIAMSACSEPAQPQPGCANKGDCEVGQTCKAGACVCIEADCACFDDADCSGVLLCNSQQGSCFEPQCLGDQLCGESEVCERGVCLPDPNADRDNDGLPDADDNCFTLVNSDQEDNDRDGLGDVCDPDDDNDGVLDEADNCPRVANPRQGDANSDDSGNLCDDAVRGTTVVGHLDLSAGGNPPPVGAIIRLTSEGLHNPAPTAVIDLGGGFEFEQALFAPGLVAVSVQMPGFVTFGDVFTSTDTPRFDLGTLTLAPEAADRQLSVTMRGQARLQGRQNHSGILVEMRRSGTTVTSTVTNPQGEFVMEASRVDHTLRLTREGFVASDEIPVIYDAQEVRFKREGVPLEEADPVELVPLLDADLQAQLSTPIEGFDLSEAIATLSGDVNQRLGVNNEGIFGAENQAPGLYTLDIVVDGHRSESLLIELASGLNTLDTIVLEPIETLLTGAVVTRIEEDLQIVEVPIEGVSVRLRREGRLVAATDTDDQGEFVFQALPVGYSLSLNAANFLPRTFDIEFDGQSFSLDGEPLSPEQPLALVRAPESDRDSDGIIDILDNCPEDFNPDLRDIDGDGSGDVCDRDADGDGMVNGLDNCPFSYNPMQEDAEGKGRGVACTAGTLEVPIEVGCGISEQHLDTRERPGQLQGSCGGGGPAEVVYRLGILEGESWSIRAEADFPLAIYLLNERGQESRCEAGDRLELREGQDLPAGNYTLVIDGFSGAEAAGPIEVSISSPSCAVTYERVIPSSTISARPISMALGDVNGDGLPDLATVSEEAFTLSVLLGNGEGTFAPAQTFAVDAPSGVAVGDIDLDGLADIVVTNPDAGNIALFKSEGQRGFLPQERIEASARPHLLQIADIDEDGFPDLVTLSTRAVTVFLGNGQGAFQARSFDFGLSSETMALGDVDLDGFLDIVTAHIEGDSVSVWPNNGQGGFSTPSTFSVGGTSPVAVALGDINEDGLLDILTANKGIEFNNDVDGDGISVLFGDGLGAFSRGQTLNVGADPSSLALGDIDADGRLDLVFSRATGDYNPPDDNITVMMGNGQGAFTAQEPVFVGGDPHVLNNNETAPRLLVLGDIDLDGAPDIVTAFSGGTTANALVSTAQRSFSPKQIFPLDRIPGTLALGDLNEDGLLDAVTASGRPVTISISLGDKQRIFLPERVFESQIERPRSLKLGDVNNDGHLDILSASERLHTLGVYLGDGRGGLSGQQTLTDVGREPVALALGDLNDDGFLDAVTSNQAGDDVTVLLGDGGSTFPTRREFPVGDRPSGVALGDLDSDDDLDIVTVNDIDATVSVLLNNGQASFAGQQTFGVGFSPFGVNVGDVTGDGHLDIITADLGNATVSVLAGDGRGSFAQRIVLVVDDAPNSVALGDIDGDGLLDIAVSNAIGDNVSVMLADGRGGFAPRQDFPVGNSPVAILLRDINRDGLLDIITSNENSNDITLVRTRIHQRLGTRLLESPLRPCPAVSTPLTDMPDGTSRFFFSEALPCRMDRLDLLVNTVPEATGTLSLSAPQGPTLTLSRRPAQEAPPRLWRPEDVATLARFETHSLNGPWALEAAFEISAAQMLVNTYPNDPFDPNTLAEACHPDLDQPDDLNTVCRLPLSFSPPLPEENTPDDDFQLTNDEDEDIFLLEGAFDGTFIRGQTLVAFVAAPRDANLTVELRAFRATEPLITAEQVEPGVWTLVWTIPQAFSGRYFTVHVRGTGVDNLAYDLAAGAL